MTSPAEAPSGANWPLRLALVMLAGGAVAVAAMLLEVARYGIDLDGYEVLHVVTHPARRRHAVVYRHDHADSSAILDGIWIISGSAPLIGSKAKPDGQPVALWRGFRLTVSWKDGRVVLAGDVDPTKVSAKPEVGANCYFEERWQLCFDPARVTFIRTKL